MEPDSAKILNERTFDHMTSVSTTSHVPSGHQETRFDRQLAKIIEHATSVFCEKGYEGASMRDLSRSSGMSLAGLYYYFESKEKLLYLVQKHYFVTVIERLQQRLQEVSGAESRMRTFILNHLEYFLAYPKAMKVLSHEDDVLKGDLGREIAAIKRKYYHSCTDLTEILKREEGLDFNTRVAVLGLFGMMNWLYTWYNPRVDGDASTLARQIGDIFLQGVRFSSAQS